MKQVRENLLEVHLNGKYYSVTPAFRCIQLLGGVSAVWSEQLPSGFDDGLAAFCVSLHVEYLCA